MNIQHAARGTRRPLIGIDGSRAVIAHRTGTEYYSASLLEALTRLPEAGQYRFVLYVNTARANEAIERLGFPLPTNWRIRAIPLRRLWTHLRLSAEMLQKPPDVLFVPSHVVPLLPPRRAVVTIHDLGYLKYPQAHTTASRLYLHLSTFFSARTASRVIAISQATKRDLIRHYGVRPGKISVIYHGRDPIFVPITDRGKLQDVAAKYGVSAPYCIHVGTLQPRKNLGLLVETWDILRRRREQPPQLLLAGKRGWLYNSLFESVQSRGLGDLIRFADYVERDDLPALYSGAAALTFPSLYEGFGLPPLEAMSCGTPVLASTATSVPEVVGYGGILLDPHDPAAWAHAILRLLPDSGLQAELRRKGLQRAAQFTWERSAMQTLHVLSEEAGR